MARFFPATLVTLYACLLAVRRVSSEAKHQLKHDTVDTFKALANFPYAIALYDIDGDGDLDCLTATRAEFNRDPPSATFILSLKDLKGHTVVNYTYNIQPGIAPDRNVVVVNYDYDHPLIDHYIYSNNENCIVMEFPMNDQQECVLWVTKEVVDNPPQICLDQFQDNCDDGVLAYDKDSCAEFLQ